MNPTPPRRVVGAGLAVICAAIAVAHTVLRDQRWAFEWRWAIFQYQLVVLLLIPAVAAAGAVEGLALNRARESVAAVGRGSLLLTWAAVRIGSWVIAGWSVGLSVVAVVMWRARGLEWPPVEAMVIPAPGLLQLSCGLMAGLIAGWSWPRVLVVPIAAAAAFVSLLSLHVFAPDAVARTGGASGSLLRLHVPVGVLVAQLAMYGALTVSLVLIPWQRERAGLVARQRWSWSVAAGLVVVVSASTLVARPPERFFDARPVPLRCSGSTPRWCTASEYEPAIDRFNDLLAPSVERIRAVGAAPATSYVLGAGAGDARDAADLMTLDPGLAPYVAVYAWLPSGCDVPFQGPLIDALGRWTQYLVDLDSGYRGAAEQPEAAELRTSRDVIASCAR